jgi:Dolichyl-phosphate-mannose-protein mannosyltransferase
MPFAYAIAAFLAHLATVSKYGYFRDELYFIACSKRLAWGYVDQPPLVAIAAWLSAPFGYNLLALRLLPAIASALTVWLAARIAAELGGGSFAQACAALATLLLPAYLLLGNTLTTTSFEPLSWTLLVFCVMRVVRTRNPRYWIGAALAFSFGMYGKYSMLLLAAALLVGLLCTRERRSLRTWWFAGGVLVAIVALAPNIAWQARYSWPFAQVVHGDFLHRHAFQNGLTLEYRNVLQNAVAFFVEQLLYTNPVFALLWLAGLVTLAFLRLQRLYRFIAIAYAVLLLLAIAFQAKGYYIIGIYTVLLAAGAVTMERAIVSRAARTAVVIPALLVTLAFVPLSLPVLPINTLIVYSRALHLTGQSGTQSHLVQPVYAEEFGWNELTRHVAAVYHSLPPSVRARTAIFADTYGDAGALDFYGPRYGLPPVLSSQNTYYLWGPRNYTGNPLIFVGASQAQRMRMLYQRMRLVDTYADPYKWVVEGATPIYLCTDPIAPLPILWPRLQWYGA